MKKFLLLIAGCIVSVCSVNAQSTVYAYRSFQESNPQVQKGPVKYSTSETSKVELIADQSKLGSVYAGEYYNYKWFVQVTQPGTQSALEGLYTIDLKDGSRTLIATAGKHLSEMSYDYSTNTMYGIRTGNEELVTLNLETGETSYVGYFKTETWEYIYMLTLAINLEGQMYGIGTDDNLYKIDKTSATCTLIGATGIDAAFTQSMTFDHNTGTLYWANNGDYTLYTVNTQLGFAQEVGKIGEKGDDSTCAMIIPFINVAKGAPDRVTDRKLTSEAKNVILSWTNPAVDAQGKDLAELTGVKIYRNGELIKTIEMTSENIGKASTYTDEALADGLYNYRIVPVNAAGEGGVDSDNLEVYVGKNNPGKVNNFKVTTGDNTATLTWEKPTEGMYGGEYDVNSVTSYVITRTKGTTSTEVAEVEGSVYTYVDEPGFGKYTYSIAAVNDMGKGTVTTSEAVDVKPNDWIVMTTGEAVVELNKEYKFYDAAGPNAYYSNSQSDVIVIRPNAQNAVTTAQFSVFSFDTYDHLKVYDGIGTDSKLVGEYTGASVPSDLVKLQSTNADGALTFEFYSDVMTRDEGWEATIISTLKKNNDLAATALTGNLYPEVNAAAEYTVKVANKGINAVSGSAYTVKLVDASNNTLAQANGVDLSANEVAEIKLNFTPTATGNADLKAAVVYASDENDENNETATVKINVLAAGSKFVVLDNYDDELYIVPTSFMSNTAVSQTLYYAEEIGVKNMDLTMISYQFAKVTANYANVPIKVWVAETDKVSLEDTNLLANEMTLVYEGNCPVSKADTDWVIPFTTPFNYTGKNLAIMVLKDAPGTDTSGVTFVGTYGDYDDPNKRTRNASVYFEDDVLDVNSTFGYSGGTMVPNIKMLFATASGVEEVAIGNQNMKVYPNPTTDVINFNNVVAQVEVLSLAGQTILKANNVSQINMESFAAGMYLVKIVDQEGETTIERVIKR